MGSIFRKFSRLTGIQFCNISRNYIDPEEKSVVLKKASLVKEKAIYFDHHSRFPEIEPGSESLFRGIHMVRNPKDMIVSAALYHAWSDEKWLHVRQEKFGGLTYQEKINSLHTIKEKLQFEMKNSSYFQIKNMSSFQTGDIFLNIKFEDLMIDDEFYKTIEIARHLGLEGEELIFFMKAVYKESLFGAKSKSEKKHIQPKEKKNEYMHVLNMEILDTYNKMFGADAQALGY